ncbi:acetate kinase [Enhydrobacter aerosaccus]|uniref:Acetate kinase n=1 Tax=Enhydrobacter aerosaccus TaxID=225324 RepID=A0A1T4R9C3_9HYPH|nr:acetate/propionate family kinase [Enhydrobacter aerosaccus]SKA12517.1 acetate kinase [Enhydrobacter aerosaccus]
MRNPILILNAGSSSLKFSVFETEEDGSLGAGVHGQVEGIGVAPKLHIRGPNGERLVDSTVSGRGHEGAIAAIGEWFRAHVGRDASFDGVGHRVVHGGMTYSKPVLIDDAVIRELETFIPLAPLHQPHNLAAIRAVRERAPTIRQVACFDTAFHAGQANVARDYALPRSLTEKGIRRYGFHGISYEYIQSAVADVIPDCANGKLVVAHLGNGASMCAIDKGMSVASTMGFTAVDGLPMGTRTGVLDPGVVLYLLQHEGMDAKAIERLLYQQSGLLGVSGISSDMRALLASTASGAKEAVDLFVYRIGRELGSLAAALQGLDALIFTAGIGENAAEIRARVCNDARWLGIELDETANARNGPRISKPGSKVSAWVIPTDENLMIARHTRHLLNG